MQCSANDFVYCFLLILKCFWCFDVSKYYLHINVVIYLLQLRHGPVLCIVYGIITLTLSLLRGWLPPFWFFSKFFTDTWWGISSAYKFSARGSFKHILTYVMTFSLQRLLIYDHFTKVTWLWIPPMNFP